MTQTNIIIPKEKIITPNTVYNALRIINASINEILIYRDIDETTIKRVIDIPKGKTPTDVYINVTKINEMLKLLYEDGSYEK